eukprot:TRINITY_DN15766_c0_g1_i1.p1 TRINITY_DN15766_c0_g1~~TRINITY_DN15766_c0_g1_i1.p1  ORF type:complete len:110 (+),score=6.76 TRINITY_DN15766_c0_g1_i1:107-436(+)
MARIPNLEGKIVTFDIAKFGDLVYDRANGTVLTRWLKVQPRDKLNDLSVSFKIEKGACEFIHEERPGGFGVDPIRSAQPESTSHAALRLHFGETNCQRPFCPSELFKKD